MPPAPAAPKPQFQPLSDFVAAEVFQDQTAYKDATGQAAPWNPKRRPQLWRKSDMAGSGIDGPDGRELGVYQGLDPATANSANPRLKQYSIALEDAGTVNIPPTGLGQTNVPGADQPAVPEPIEINPGTQVLVSSRAAGGSGFLPLVLNTDVVPEVALTPGERLIVSHLEAIRAELRKG